jgi:hypothetical protein
MSTLHTTRGALRRWVATGLTLAAALVAIAVAGLFIALGGGSPQHVATPRHGASTLAPRLRHDRTAAAGIMRRAAPPTGDCTYVRAEHSCVTSP